MVADEHWKAVPGEPLLEASSLGNIRRLDRAMNVAAQGQDGRLRGNLRRVMPGGPMRPWLERSTGYLMVSYMADRKRIKRAVHRLVAAAFVDGAFPGASVDHVDGDRTNNHPSNLQWVTPAENTRRQWRSGRLAGHRGETHPGAKLGDADVAAIRSARAAGESAIDLATRYGVSTALIYKIAAGLRRAA